MKINIKGLKFQNWMYLMIFSMIILAVLWALQFLLLGSFYKSMKLNEVKNIGNKITDEFDNTNFSTVMNEYAFNNNLRIILLDESGRMTGNFDGFARDEAGVFSIGGMGVFPQNALNLIKQEFDKTDSDRISFLNTDTRDDIAQAVYVAKLSDETGATYYLYINSPVPPIDSTISVLKTQFIIIIVILFFLSLAVAQWISKRMSKPIINLTKSAERMVKGELDANFHGEGFTEIHQLASALNYATDELRSLDNYRKEFIANVSHDLKTPLTIIKFYGEMIRDISGNNPEKRNEHCETIIKETDWLTDMVGEILELSKLESGNAQVAKTIMDLSRCLMDTLASFQVLVDRGEYCFETNIEKNLYISGNEPLLRRVFYNLISNAVNYTGEDKRVLVSLKSTGNQIRFEVTDTGEGIPKDKQKAIWDRYYKSNETHKRAVIGTGLGLSIVKSVLVLHNIGYGIHSDIGKGSTFWFELEKISNSIY